MHRYLGRHYTGRRNPHRDGREIDRPGSGIQLGTIFDYIRTVQRAEDEVGSQRRQQRIGYALELIGSLRPRTFRERALYIAGFFAISAAVALGLSIPAAEQQGNAARNSVSIIGESYHLGQEHTFEVVAATGATIELGSLSVAALAAFAGDERRDRELSGRLQFPSEIASVSAPYPPSTFKFVMSNPSNRSM